ncbi:MAG: UDP-N-acetylmuramoyl-L-alanyl-D-glutamate--2,6-diaminopimelate ligase [Clostridia bacterium]|nr:UDP-N-acetylmuramoyl-L-alanyl-D-glutamate--2,6-diaminopimelate ligase [Clostridia bacterium]
MTDIVEEVRPGSLFVAVEGGRNDGHLLVRQALERGAAAVVTGRRTGAENEIVVEEPRKALGLLCAGFYGHPDRRLKLIGITGTNGKTTTAEYLKTLLERTGRRCGVIGTLGCGAGEERTETGYTTPGAPAFFAALRRMADAGCGYCAAEVSSQALSQYRVEAATFSLGVLTNLGRDHLDYHGTPAAYAEAKSRLFRLSEAALLNADDACLGQMAAAAEDKPCFTYSVKRRDADFCVTELWETSEGFDFTVAAAGEKARLRLPAVCGFTVYNALAAVAAATLCGVPLRQAAAALDPLPEVKGRMQRISGGGIAVYIDFAHTPEALSGALRGLRRTEGRIITVFGCGGGRDRGKRPRIT